MSSRATGVQRRRRRFTVGRGLAALDDPEPFKKGFLWSGAPEVLGSILSYRLRLASEIQPEGAGTMTASCRKLGHFETSSSTTFVNLKGGGRLKLVYIVLVAALACCGGQTIIESSGDSGGSGHGSNSEAGGAGGASGAGGGPEAGAGGSSATGGSSASGGSPGNGGSAGSPIDSGLPEVDSSACVMDNGGCVLCDDNKLHCGLLTLPPCPPGLDSDASCAPAVDAGVDLCLACASGAGTEWRCLPGYRWVTISGFTCE